jgi:hypothetical protein
MSPFPAPHCAASLKSDPRPALQLVAVIRFNAVAADITRIVAAAATRLTHLRAQRRGLS